MVEAGKEKAQEHLERGHAGGYKGDARVRVWVPQLCQYLYFRTSKASKLRSSKLRTYKGDARVRVWVPQHGNSAKERRPELSAFVL